MGSSYGFLRSPNHPIRKLLSIFGNRMGLSHTVCLSFPLKVTWISATLWVNWLLWASLATYDSTIHEVYLGRSQRD